MSIPRRRPTLVAALGAALALVTTSACSGGSSDVVGAPAATQAPAAAGSGGTINLYAYAVPKPGFDKLIPAFTATPAGQGVHFQQSYGASGDQSRKVAAGAERRLRQLLRRARRHPAGRRRTGRHGLERRRAQGHPVRLGRDHRRPQGQPQGHQGLGRPAQAGRRGRHARTRSAPARRSGTCWRRTPPRATAARTSAGRPGLRRHAGQRPRQDPAEVRPRGHRGVPAGHRRRAAQLRERGDLHRAQRRPGRARHAAARPSRSRTRVAVVTRAARTSPRPRRSTTSCTRRRRRSCWAAGRLPPGRPDGRRRSTPRTSRRRRSSGPSPTSVAGRPSTATLFKKDTGDHRRDLRRGHPVGRHDDHHRDHASGSPSHRDAVGPRAGTRSPRRAGAPATGSRPGAPSAIGVVGALAQRHRAAAAGGADRARPSTRGSAGFWDAVTAPAALAALRVTLGRRPRSSPWSTPSWAR